MARQESTPLMQLADVLLREKGKGGLKQYLETARAKDKETGRPAKTWDDIAFEIRSETGIKAVRESVRQWAFRLGVETEGDEKEAPAVV